LAVLYHKLVIISSRSSMLNLHNMIAAALTLEGPSELMSLKAARALI
jgi:hypothetical protein